MSGVVDDGSAQDEAVSGGPGQPQIQMRPHSPLPSASHSGSSSASSNSHNDPLMPIAENWCHTQVKVVKFNYMWTINNFSFCQSQRAYRFVQGKDWGFKKFIRRDFLLDETNGLLPDDRLSIFCEVSVVAETVNVTGQTNAAQLKVPPCSLSDDMSVLFEKGTYSDVTLTTNTNPKQSFKVHKAILASRSDVFAAMFGNPLREAQSNEVVLHDMETEVLREMLYYIYTGHVPNLDAMAPSLIAAADEYHLDRLKVMNTDGWKQLIKEHPLLLADTFRALVTQQTPPVVLTQPPKKRIKHCPY
ncbi:hypothetical protein WR25_14455 [Diploscapter pachys]|uniref:BTB domain-containing protein n=1 Tax=Diploscapter pachys TaxID=2018661 RepID=A0A2A2LCQ7_9BILA|nr:hypothetical protein WR25_14455 [Diploscapter pachys]